ncbi:tumor necrosis factor receptor superfamily member 10B-like isoform X2 [Onychostruthus taczanowskii]|uniref:tumor necrosis factor receptor superfamily member 10B-like isoform X2 n=1 Tax=Onychostruthus taczanowskii TaxID=356909 RepID=UPI001B800E05|nr:tumor necrosis factor receptor superfamily member 10B-like isoform X2 [Onychostruthus taczanowskii]
MDLIPLSQGLVPGLARARGPCGLVVVAALGANAVTLRRRDSLYSLDLGWGGEDHYYRNSDGLYCQKCPEGTYIAEECKEQKGSGRCEPCRPGEYMEYPNAFRWCRDCSVCREDQVKLSPCQPVRNTVCVCRNGTFCPPDHPCEMCQKCQPRCPEGQVVLKHCTPDSDLQCGPDVDTFPFYLKVITAVFVVVITVVILLGIALCCWKHSCSSSGDGTPSSRKPFEMSSMFQKLLWCKTGNVGTEDNQANRQTEMRQRHTAPERQEMLPSGSERPWRSLVPAPGYDPSAVLQRSFYTFAGKVPKENWKRFGHNLNLEDNDIPTDKSHDNFYDMLRRWQNREGTKASVNTLLDTLDRISLGGVAENISGALVQSGFFQHETS